MIFIFSVIYFVICLLNLEAAVLVLIAALPLYLVRFSVLSIPSTLLEVMILISFSVWLFKYTEFKNFLRGHYKAKDYLSNRKERKAYPFRWEIALILFTAFSGLAIAGFKVSALGIWKAYFFEPIIAYILILNILKKREQIERAFWAISVSALAVSIFAIYQKFTGAFIPNPLWAAEETRRVTSFFEYPNAVGLFLAPIVMLIFGWLWQSITTGQKNKWKIAAFQSVVILSSLLAIYFAKSEGAIVGLLAAFIVFGLLAGKRLRLITIGLAVIAVILVFSNVSLKQYAIEKATLNDFSGTIRRLQWTETWEMLKDGRLVFGSGLDSYQESIIPYHQEGMYFNFERDPDFRRKIVIFNEKYKAEHWQPLEIYKYPHNIFLNFWTEIGFIGALAFIWMILKSITIAFRSMQADKAVAWVRSERLRSFYMLLGLLTAMIAIVVHGLVDVPYFKNDLAVLFWIMIALLSLIKLNVNSEKKDKQDKE